MRRLCCLVITPVDFAYAEYTVLRLYMGMDMDVHVAARRIAEAALQTRERPIDAYITLYAHTIHQVIVKLTPDAPGEPPSAMRVVGAARPFAYDAAAGAAGCF